jgi:membrane-associated protein
LGFTASCFSSFLPNGFRDLSFPAGDSLLFVAGAGCAGRGRHEYRDIDRRPARRAVLGNMVNYQVGRLLGPKVFHWKIPLLQQGGAAKTHASMKSTVANTGHLAFPALVPYLRPLRGRHRRHVLCQVPALQPDRRCRLGHFAVPGRFLLGNMPWVKQNLSLLIVGIIVVSLIPVAVGYLKHKAAA